MNTNSPSTGNANASIAGMTNPTDGANTSGRSVPTPNATTDRYVAPNGFSQHFLNGPMKLFIRLGRNPAGGQLLQVPGRVSGKVQQVPVNPMELDGVTYLVAPRGNTEWVRNLRRSGIAELRTGRRVTPITAVEVPDTDKPTILRNYLERWGRETGRFFDGATPVSDDATFAALAPGMPVFKVEPVER